jgi:hypothetical protein
VIQSTTHEKFDLAQIRRFTENELERLNKSKKPFCLQVGVDVIVGRYRVNKQSSHKWIVTGTNINPVEFSLRKNAILYCFAMQSDDSSLAFDVKQTDQKLARLEVDATAYRRRYNEALEGNDTFNIVHFSNRYTEVVYRIAGTKKQLKEFLKRNKYIKA